MLLMLMIVVVGILLHLFVLLLFFFLPFLFFFFVLFLFTTALCPPPPWQPAVLEEMPPFTDAQTTLLQRLETKRTTVAEKTGTLAARERQSGMKIEARVTAPREGRLRA